MRKFALLVISMSVFLSCNKNHSFDIEDVTIAAGDSVNVKIKRLDVKIESGGTYNIDINNDGVNDWACGTYNIDVNDDGVNDFALCCFYHYFPDVIFKGSMYYWSVKSLSENNKVLCDTISYSYFYRELFFIAPKPLFIKDQLSASCGLWLVSPPERDPLKLPGPLFIMGDLLPGSGFLLFSYVEPFINPPDGVFVKGGITLAEFSKINQKYIGIQSEKNGTVTMGWLLLKYNPYAEVILKEIGTADFPINGQ